MGQCFILETSAQRVFLGDHTQIFNQSQDTQYLYVNSYGDRRVAILHFVEVGTRYIRPGTDRLHGKASAQPCILETLS